MVPYDWRVDDASSAQTLWDALEYLDSVIYPTGDYELFLLAHSNGGLVSRYVLEAMPPGGWSGKLKKLITLATPHLGAPLAWKAVTGQLVPGDHPFIEMFIQSVVDNKKFTSTLELLPPPLDSTFIVDAESVPQNIYTAEQGSQLYRDMVTCNVDIDKLQTTVRAFMERLHVPSPPASVEYEFFYGTGLPALAGTDSTVEDAAFLYDPGTGVPSVIFAPGPEKPVGDGVVPEMSAACNFPPGILTRKFPLYNHGHMGGSDMVRFRDAVVTAAVDMGLDPVGPAVAAAATREQSPA